MSADKAPDDSSPEETAAQEPAPGDISQGASSSTDEGGSNSSQGTKLASAGGGPRAPLWRRLSLVSVLIGVFAVGWAGGVLLQPVSTEPSGRAARSSQPEVWTCSMHPQIKLPKPGKCPICFMDLIKLESGGDNTRAELVMSEAGARLAEIRTSKARRAIAEARLRFVGEVAYDETRVKTISAWIPGRLDKLYVDYTGVAVREGDHLVYLYSPELISAQEELLQAIKSVEELEDSNSELILSTAKETVKAAREKLRLLGLKERQVRALEKEAKVQDHMTIYAPVGGIVVHKNAVEGMYVQTGTPIYKIADLSFVWVNLEAYESDLAWLRYGQTVEFESEAYPGELFQGRISFIDPVLDTRTRTVRVRVNAPNADGRLKPGMFVRASLVARMVGEGKVLEPSLAGKWISPMHPEVIKDEAGACDVCGMDLVRAEDLGLSRPEGPFTPPVLIPASAVLYTGKRSVVYVRKPGAGKPTFEGRVVALGPRAGDEIIVRSGLEEGDEVVVNGAFKIDSALQIQARPSMMSAAPQPEAPAAPPEKPKGGAPTISGAVAGELRLALSAALGPYLAAQSSLAADDPEGAKAAAAPAAEALEAGAASAQAPDSWRAALSSAAGHARKLSGAADLTVQRQEFYDLSKDLIRALRAVGSPRPLAQMTCPMAFGGLGGAWLQEPGAVRNPYFGAAMLRCGEVSREFKAESAASLRGVPPADPGPGLQPLTRSYLTLQEALTRDDLGSAMKAVMGLEAWLENPDLPEPLKQLDAPVSALVASEDLKALREAFAELSEILIPLLKPTAPRELSRVRCPMARGGAGGEWLQEPGAIANPYLGVSMPRCGEVVEQIPAKGSR